MRLCSLILAAAALLALAPAAPALAQTVAERTAIEAACGRLVLDYAYHRDRFDAAGVAGVFTPDGVLDMGAQAFKGREAIAARIRSIAGQTTVRHLMSNVRVTVLDAATAEIVSYVQVVTAPPATAPGRPVTHPGAATIGEYRDRCVRTPEGWRLADRRLTVIMSPPAQPPAPPRN